jgi:hypothetical protein
VRKKALIRLLANTMLGLQLNEQRQRQFIDSASGTWRGYRRFPQK